MLNYIMCATAIYSHREVIYVHTYFYGTTYVHTVPYFYKYISYVIYGYYNILRSHTVKS